MEPSDARNARSVSESESACGERGCCRGVKRGVERGVERGVRVISRAASAAFNLRASSAVRNTTRRFDLIDGTERRRYSRRAEERRLGAYTVRFV